MRVRNLSRLSADESLMLPMTPMIDVVFQLLVFFIMSFKIAVQEGDFNIKMPLAAPSTGTVDEQLPPMKLRLTANADGTLTSIQLNERQFPNFNALHQHILGVVGTDTGPGSIREQAEIELDTDYQLRYEHVIDAISSVTGYRRGDDIVKLVEKIRFAPPRTAP